MITCLFKKLLSKKKNKKMKVKNNHYDKYKRASILQKREDEGERTNTPGVI